MFGKRRTMCQCTKCNEVFDYEKRDARGLDSRCPSCGSRFHIIQFRNFYDQYYVKKFERTLNE